MRTRFFDDYLLASGCRQIVLLAAGLDTRAYRLPWPHAVRVFELDLPEVLDFKAEVLADSTPEQERVALPVDLTGEWADPLVHAGFRAEAPTAWLVEGLLMYLSTEDGQRLFWTITGLSAPGSRIGVETRDSALVRMIQRREATRLRGAVGDRREVGGELLRSPSPGGPRRWLEAAGWTVKINPIAELGVRYRRSVPALFDPPGPRPDGLLEASSVPRGK